MIGSGTWDSYSSDAICGFYCMGGGAHMTGMGIQCMVAK
jgi:hypothetical protein